MLRNHLALWALALGLLSACAGSHGRADGDAGALADGAACGAMPALFCVSACGSDAGRAPICTTSGWACPPGTIDARTCADACGTPPPYPGCACVLGSWQCDIECPSGIDPWNPDAPGNACFAAGAHCTSGGGACGGGMFCDCTAGRWSCAVAEPDPVCWCGREPSEGDPCSEEGASCGACCPVAGGPTWAPMICAGGRWTALSCPAIVCPPAECPADTSTLLGEPCVEGARCGDPCCSNAVSCIGGVWVRGPEADCFACYNYACGDGACRDDQACRAACGPDDGLVHSCVELGPTCRDCSCTPVGPGQTCTMIDGHPHVSGGPCG